MRASARSACLPALCASSPAHHRRLGGTWFAFLSLSLSVWVGAAGAAHAEAAAPDPAPAAAAVAAMHAALPTRPAYGANEAPAPGADRAAAMAPVAAIDPGVPVARVVVSKGARMLELRADDDRVLFEVPIALGSDPVGHKQRQGDGRTPEGNYVLDWRKPDSDYYRALHISYPNAADRARAARDGVDPGGAIMIHGLPNGLGVIGKWHRRLDWTDGCIAVTNAEMDEIWRRVADGTPIEIRP